MDKELIRCYQCRHFKPIGRGHSGWCQDAKPKIRVNAVDFCDHAEKKEAESDELDHIMSEVSDLYSLPDDSDEPPEKDEPPEDELEDLDEDADDHDEAQPRGDKDG